MRGILFLQNLQNCTSTCTTPCPGIQNVKIEDMDKYGDRIVDWYFNRDDGIPQHLKMNQLGRLADIIKYEGPQTGFWKVKANLYDNIALTGFDPRRICWNEMIYDPADNKPTTFAKEPSPPPPASPAPSVIVLSPKKRQHEEIIVLDSDDEDSGPDSKKSKSDSEEDDEDNNYSDDTDDSFIDDEETDEDDLEVINGKQ